MASLSDEEPGPDGRTGQRAHARPRRRSRRIGWLRNLAWAATAIVVAFGLGLLVPRPLLSPTRSTGEPTRRILLLNNPIHTDIAIPIDDAVRERFAFLRRSGLPIDAPGARYLVFGWGGREFYIETPTWSELKLRPLLKGLTLDRSVMHVDVSGALAEPHPEISGYDVGDRAFEQLLDYIRSSFEQAEAPKAIPGAFYGDFDAFYPANGNFTAVLGCNTWTAAALRAAGLRTGWWNPLPASLAWSLDLHNNSAADPVELPGA